jgi:hypothetical protein
MIPQAFRVGRPTTRACSSRFRPYAPNTPRWPGLCWTEHEPCDVSPWVSCAPRVPRGYEPSLPAVGRSLYRLIACIRANAHRVIRRRLHVQADGSCVTGCLRHVPLSESAEDWIVNDQGAFAFRARERVACVGPTSLEICGLPARLRRLASRRPLVGESAIAPFWLGCTSPAGFSRPAASRGSTPYNAPHVPRPAFRPQRTAPRFPSVPSGIATDSHGKTGTYAYGHVWPRMAVIHVGAKGATRLVRKSAPSCEGRYAAPIPLATDPLAAAIPGNRPNSARSARSGMV